nr:hypothetical protein [Acinetobacter haemolyticus]
MNQLEQHLYAQAFYCFGIGVDQEIYTEIEKREILEKLSKGVQAVKYAICTDSILLAEIMNTLHQLQKNIENTTDSDQKVETLRLLFNQYNDAFSELNGLPRAFINRVKGVRGAKKRYAQVLDKKYAIFRSVLIKKVEKDGRFKNAKQAVDGVIEDVEQAFEVFDRGYATDKINEIKNKIKTKQEELKKFKKTKSSDFAIKPVSAEKRITRLNQELEKWTTALHNDQLYEEFPKIFLLKPEDYLDQILARHLREQKAFCDQVTEDPSNA